MAFAQAPAAPVGEEYPVKLALTGERQINRLWGIPFIGVFVRMILAIPHFIVLGIMVIGLYVYFALGWIPILLMGRQPSLVAGFLTEYLHRAYRIAGYVFFLLPGGYPPFGVGDPNPVDLKVAWEGRTLSRFWGVLLLGPLVRYIILIPHFVVLFLLAIVAYVSFLVLWIPILVTGKYPDAFASFYTSFLRYGARIAAYMLLLPVPYPPFSLG